MAGSLRTGVVCALFAVSVLVAACTGGRHATPQDVLVSLTEEVIVPRFQAVSDAMNGLRTALHTLCATPSPTTLTAARTAWRDARTPWMRSQAMWFGPVMQRRTRSWVDWSPVHEAGIQQMLSERDTIGPEHVREFLPANQRGLGAIEYVLFADDQQVLTQLTQPDSIHCAYVTSLGDVIAAEMAGVLADWTGTNADGNAYAAYFNGTGRSALVDQAAVDEVVRTSVFLTRSITDMQLGKALGADSGQPEPAAIPGGAGHNVVADLWNQVAGMQDVYVGAEAGFGLSDLVRGVSKETDTRVVAGFEEALAAIDKLEEPLRDKVLNDPELAWQAHARLKELQRVLNTEVVSLLGVSVGFADTDGDSG